MDEPLQPPSTKTKRFMDIVPGNQTAPSPTSRPTIKPKLSQPDPMVAVKPDNFANQAQAATPENDANIEAQELMQREYQEASHELPAGNPEAVDQLSSPQLGPVIGTHGPQKLKRSRLDKFLLIILALIILALILDLLLDHGTIKISGLPHTHFWHQWRS